MLAIPYLRQGADGRRSVVSMRFRCVDDTCDHARHSGGKYATVAGDRPRLFNAVELTRDHSQIAICEGEMDAITATLCGVPAVGVPGVEAWRPAFARPFAGYERVLILADADDDGQGIAFAKKLADQLGNAVIVPAERGHDVSSMVAEHGPHALLERTTA